jgi:hypothetical protein
MQERHSHGPRKRLSRLVESRSAELQACSLARKIGRKSMGRAQARPLCIRTESPPPHVASKSNASSRRPRVLANAARDLARVALRLESPTAISLNHACCFLPAGSSRHGESPTLHVATISHKIRPSRNLRRINQRRMGQRHEGHFPSHHRWRTDLDSGCRPRRRIA